MKFVIDRQLIITNPHESETTATSTVSLSHKNIFRSPAVVVITQANKQSNNEEESTNKTKQHE